MSARASARRPRARREGGAGLDVFIYGGGKVGRGLARAIRDAGLSVTLRAARDGLPEERIDADLVILAVRDRDIAPCAEALRDRALVGHRDVAVVHCAGALGPEALEAVRSDRVAVAQMHPMISFASPSFAPSLARGQLHVDGDPAAVRAARSLGARLGMTPRTLPGLDRVAYHAAAGLVANGAAALAAGGIDLLERAGVDRTTAAQMLGPLLRTVADNVEALGVPDALTGPVRRGDATAVARHLETLRRLAPHLVPFYVAAGATQLPLARALGEAPPAAFDAIQQLLDGIKHRG
ncbi:hypothetical protein SOCEGT47_021810 [Sorangium cellulosum]|uniref:DUF2520 domain-containing protein n=1 Tax=Sorangium cellulosum TaxID=56 RepID=A0A4P2PXX7_SORCE|nr:DUF2520 domain-containing protein [Sorangium cellulosum]AUX21694.1 hypothetical protein SOCEGT47_021810 [Sorangium cellulosum]